MLVVDYSIVRGGWLRTIVNDMKQLGLTASSLLCTGVLLGANMNAVGDSDSCKNEAEEGGEERG